MKGQEQMRTSSQIGYIGAVIGMLVVGSLTSLQASITFSDDFSTGLNPSYWSTYQTIAGTYSVNAAGGNIKLATIADNPGWYMAAYVQLNLQAVTARPTLSDDFSTQVRFADASVTGANTKNQVELHTYYADGSVFYMVYDNNGGTLNAHGFNGNSEVNHTSVNGSTSGIFRITRNGSTVSGFYNDLLIFSETRNSPLAAIDFSLQNNYGSDDRISVTYDDFSLTYNPVPEPSTCIVGSLLLLPLGAGLLRRFRK